MYIRHVYFIVSCATIGVKVIQMYQKKYISIQKTRKCCIFLVVHVKNTKFFARTSVCIARVLKRATMNTFVYSSVDRTKLFIQSATRLLLYDLSLYLSIQLNVYQKKMYK